MNKNNKKVVIKIRKFENRILSKKPLNFQPECMATFTRISSFFLMVDCDYYGGVFNFDDVFYAEDLRRNNWEVHFDADKIDEQTMIIYIDVFGDEKRGVKKLKDFKKQKYE